MVWNRIPFLGKLSLKSPQTVCRQGVEAQAEAPHPPGAVPLAASLISSHSSEYLFNGLVLLY